METQRKDKEQAEDSWAAGKPERTSLQWHLGLWQEQVHAVAIGKMTSYRGTPLWIFYPRGKADLKYCVSKVSFCNLCLAGGNP